MIKARIWPGVEPWDILPLTLGLSGQLGVPAQLGGACWAHLSEVLMSDAWFYDAGKYGQVGPLTLRELQDRLATVSNPTDVPVWRGGFRDWKLAKDVPELAAQIVVAPSLPRESTTASRIINPADFRVLKA
jgi:hypothetical protein